MTLSFKAKVSRKIFVSADSGFGVFLVKVDGARESRVIVGNLHALSVGDFLEIEGEESEHPRFGKQVKVSRFEFIKPQDSEGIARYLSSGRFRGIGRKTAQKIAERFGAVHEDRRMETFQHGGKRSQAHFLHRGDTRVLADALHPPGLVGRAALGHQGA